MTRIFTRLIGIAAPLPLTNIDTDKILPGRFLKTISREGLGKALFYDMRYTSAGQERPEFILNREPWRQAKILITYDNFGCGSSREHAPWALADFGITCIIAPSFSDIFYNNCFKNGILPIALNAEKCEMLMARANDPKQAIFTIDLPSQTIWLEGDHKITFGISAQKRDALLEGRDDIAVTLTYLHDIERLEKKRPDWMPHIPKDLTR